MTFLGRSNVYTCWKCGGFTVTIDVAEGGGAAMKTGDTVRHLPSEETWVVGFVDGDRLYPLGWPPTMARTSDCVLIQECSPEESLRQIEHMAQVLSDGPRWRWARAELERRKAAGEFASHSDVEIPSHEIGGEG